MATMAGRLLPSTYDVTAPSEAERTVTAYLASTPRETRSAGLHQPLVGVDGDRVTFAQ